jgi:hypothetical protein
VLEAMDGHRRLMVCVKREAEILRGRDAASSEA